MERRACRAAAVNDIANWPRPSSSPPPISSTSSPRRAGENSAPRIVGLPIAFDRKRLRSPRSAPKLGEHTEEVLGALKP